MGEPWMRVEVDGELVIARGVSVHAWAGGGVLDREEACEQIHE